MARFPRPGGLLPAGRASHAQQIAQMGQEAAQAVDNGTDPTKFSKVVEAKYEYLDPRDGFSSGTLRLSYTHPLGEQRDYSLRFRGLVTSVDVLGNEQFGVGDVSVQLAHVFGLTKEHGFVA
jgi:hemolysin activation/secretion protein